MLQKVHWSNLYTLVHDEKALKLLVDTIGQVKSSVTFWL